MKVDISACFYRQRHRWPFFLWGLEENRDFIGHVYVTNDELWTDENRPSPVPDYVTLLDHPHRGWGCPLSLDQGVSASSADYVLIMSVDQTLCPGYLERMTALAAPERMVLGQILNFVPPVSIADLPNPRIKNTSSSIYTQPDMVEHTLKIGRRWWLVRAGRLSHRDSHLAIGGHDPEYFLEAGKGCDDQDYGIRWQAAYGPGSIVPAMGAHTWHFPAPMGPYPLHSRERLARLSGQLLCNNQYQLFTSRRYRYNLRPDCALVSHDPEYKALHGDSSVDCVRPVWIPDRSANLIVDPMPEEWVKDPDAHLRIIHSKLAPEGKLHVPREQRILHAMRSLNLFDWDIGGTYVEAMAA